MEWVRVKLSVRSTAENQPMSYMADMQTSANAPSRMTGTQGKSRTISIAEHGKTLGLEETRLPHRASK